LSSKILQLSPRSSTRIPRRKITAQPSWSAAQAPLLDMSLDLSLDMGFVRSWFESDSDPAENSAESSSGRKVNWGAISGMALSVAFSLVCWAGVIWIVERVWR
jgi:hypothetical protein